MLFTIITIISIVIHYDHSLYIIVITITIIIIDIVIIVHKLFICISALEIISKKCSSFGHTSGVCHFNWAQHVFFLPSAILGNKQQYFR